MSRPEKRSSERQEAAPAGSEAPAAEMIAATNAARAELSRISGLVARDGPAKGEAIGAGEIAKRAKGELAQITGLDADHVSAVTNGPDGWHVTVDLIELRRIPASTDVLAAYEAVFSSTGVLLTYQRRRRYFRDQMMEE